MFLYNLGGTRHESEDDLNIVSVCPDTHSISGSDISVRSARRVHQKYPWYRHIPYRAYPSLKVCVSLTTRETHSTTRWLWEYVVLSFDRQTHVSAFALSLSSNPPSLWPWSKRLPETFVIDRVCVILRVTPKWLCCVPRARDVQPEQAPG